MAVKTSDYSLMTSTDTLSYNGVQFSVLYKSKISGRPILNESRRAVKCVEYTIEVRSYVTFASETTDSTMQSLRTLLTKPAGELHYDNKGFGSLAVNVPGGAVWDAEWGPIPELIDYDPIGNDQAALVTWVVKTRIPECSYPPKAVNFKFKTMAFDYSVDYKVDRHGLTTVTTSGYIEIPITRKSIGDTTLQDNADAYYNLVYTPLAPGYQREEQPRKLSMDRRRLDFSFIDRQMVRDGLPNYCTDADGSYSIRSKNGAMVQWSGAISATYTVLNTAPRDTAWTNFFLLVMDRLNVIKKNSTGVYYLTGVDVDEGLYRSGNTVKLAINFIFGMNLVDLLGKSGLFRTVPNTEWSKWVSTVQLAQRQPRGIDGISYANEMDAIIDLCTPLPPKQPRFKGAHFTHFHAGRPDTSFGTDIPDPQYSWFQWQNQILVDVDPGIVRHKPLPRKLLSKSKKVPIPSSDITESSSPGTTGKPAPILAALQKLAGGAFGNAQGKQLAQSTEPVTVKAKVQTKDIVQQVATPTYTIRMIGWAMRVGYRIPIPSLVTFGGAPVIPSAQTIGQEVIDTFNGVPIYGAEWVLDYWAPSSLQSALEYPTNPMARVGG